MNRRQILKYTIALTGSALCAPLSAGLLADLPKQASTINTAKHLRYFNAKDFKLLSLIMDVILPRTDSPSATDVDTHLMFDQMFGVVFDPTYRAKFSTLFADLQTYLAAKNFSQQATQHQVQILQDLETQENKSNAYWAYIDIKQQTIAYFLSSEVIAEKFLNYLPIPGEYKPCVPLEDLGGKAWAI